MDGFLPDRTPRVSRLVDRMGNLEDAVRWAADLAGVTKKFNPYIWKLSLGGYLRCGRGYWTGRFIRRSRLNTAITLPETDPLF